jgi:CheY-like chemotaxis protein
MKKILIIEDNLDMNYLLNFALEEGLHEIKSCFDGLTGLQIIKSFLPDVVVLDLELPKMCGRKVLRRIQKMTNPPFVIVFSSSGWQEISAPNIKYCPKGEYSLMELLGVIKESS